ncbi:hypothetical protein M3Y97_00753000 [Aphelenchoides bicaudatus]|nr:hypothetical protein M3Y97_00753000 [Aphelenchoides bicaudatus]
MLGRTISVVFFFFAALIACILASEQVESHLFEPSQFNADYDLYQPFEEEPAKRVPAYSGPFVRFGKRGGMSRSLRNGASIEPLIRFGKRSDKRLSSAPFVRFGRAYRQSVPHVRFGR